MSITTFSGLLTELTRLIDGDDVSVSDVNTATLQQIISLAERRIYREVRSRHNEASFSGVTVTSNLVPIPADYQSASIVHFGGYPLKPIAEAALIEYMQCQPTGDVVYFAEAGPNFTFAPAAGDGDALQGRYFQRLPDLDATTLPSNALFLAENDLFLYACLAESAPFYGQDARIPLWESKYTAIRDLINLERNRGAHSMGRMQRRPSTPILR